MKPGEWLEGRFQLQELLGEGGMGQVFKAWDAELERPVAIKTLLSQFLSDPAAVQDMKREVRMSQKLAHPGIVSVYDYRVHERTPCIVMEFVEGETLSHYLFRRPERRLSEEEFRLFARQILDAVHHAHQRGVIHRDLKPANVMVQPDGTLKLMDFGIAAAIKATYTRITGHSSGLTIQYSSPEQIRGEDPAVCMDIYALGCVFYEMLSGRPPFHQGEILYQHLHETPRPLAGVSPVVSRAVMACLEKDPARRPPSASAVWEMMSGGSAPAPEKTVRLRPSAAPEPSPVKPAPRPAPPPEESQLPYTPELSFGQRQGASSGSGITPKILLGAAGVLAIIGIVWINSSAPKPREPKEATAARPVQPVAPTAGINPSQSDSSWNRPGESRFSRADGSGERSAVADSPPGAEAAAPRAGAVLVVNGVRMEFISIPPGEFVMGCSPWDGECEDDETPAHRVRITKGFEIGKFEVTQAEWEAVMGSNPSYFRGADRPVDNVSWEDVQQFLSRLNARGDGYRYRLPTEAEWEYAARAGTTGKYYGELDEIAWYGGNSGNQTHPVGQKKPNAWGLHDMLGNVREWCWDWYDGNYYRSSPEADPRGAASGTMRLLRGGSWSSYPWSLRVSFRGGGGPSSRYSFGGFRCVRER